MIAGVAVTLLVGGLVTAKAARAAPGAGQPIPHATGDEAREWIAEIAELAELDEEWIAFLEAKADAETAGTMTSNVVLGDPALYPEGSKASPSTSNRGPSEARAARLAFERARDLGRFANCSNPAKSYQFGSLGWWSQLPAIALASYAGSDLVCLPPGLLLHPVDQVITIVDYARRLARTRQAFKDDPTWLSMWVGMGLPSKIADPDRRARVLQRASGPTERVGRSLQWLETKTTALPTWDAAEKRDQIMRQWRI